MGYCFPGRRFSPGRDRLLVLQRSLFSRELRLVFGSALPFPVFEANDRLLSAVVTSQDTGFACFRRRPSGAAQSPARATVKLEFAEGTTGPAEHACLAPGMDWPRTEWKWLWDFIFGSVSRSVGTLEELSVNSRT